MALTFTSKSIKKLVDIDDVQHLSIPELRLLRDELKRAIITMEESLGNIAYEKHVAGETYNETWHLRVKRKQEICGVFLEKIEITFDEKNNTLFRTIFNKHFHNLLLEMITLDQYETLERQAKDLAFKELL
mgnify:FL=1|tara:strand:+ start:2375 stop:2767 length:393 start_codon:yes stop_codon:yes gene_type:complete